jgi:thiamine pyrophosphate-dependent acetolactate synthase large subunit-like protein
MDIQIKKELHLLIENCENKDLLIEAKELLQSQSANDWWDELNDVDKNLLMKSEEEYEKGKFISHHKLMQEIGQWKKK